MATTQLVPQDAAARTGGLALSLQEPFTVAARLRANRQSAMDSASFRAQVKALLGTADRDARARGYDPEFVKLAVYAYIAFLDETVLNSSQPMFAEWTRQPLQEEVFGEHMAGETFFRYLGDLLGRQDSTDLADLLEVYELCLLLGYRGKYAASDPNSLQGLVQNIQQKIQRIRGANRGQVATWMLPQNDVAENRKDPWMRRLLIITGAGFGLTAALWLIYFFALRNSASSLGELTRQLMGTS